MFLGAHLPVHQDMYVCKKTVQSSHFFVKMSLLPLTTNVTFFLFLAHAFLGWVIKSY